MLFVYISYLPFERFLAATIPCGFDSITMRPTFGIVIWNTAYSPEVELNDLTF